MGERPAVEEEPDDCRVLKDCVKRDERALRTDAS